jgi:hypothetical protein
LAIPASRKGESKMTNVDTNATAKESARKVADHFLLDAAGNVTKRMEDAVGIRYVSVDKPNAPFTYMFDGATPGHPITMLALFGAKTKATNEASRVRNGDGGGADEQLDAIEDVFEQLTKGVWREKAEGGGGARIDWGIVTDILYGVLGDKAAGDLASYQGRLGVGAPKDALTKDQDDYRKKVWSNDAIKAEYRKRTGKTGAAIDSLA